MTKPIFFHLSFVKCYSTFTRVGSITEKFVSSSIYGREFVLGYYYRNFMLSGSSHRFHQNQFRHHISSCKPDGICWEGSSHSVLTKKLEFSLKNHQVGEAWEAFTDFRSLYGFPNNSLVSMLLAELSYSYDRCWLLRASDLVLSILKEKPDLLRPDILSKLLLSLARAQMPVPASMILRLMLEKESLPATNILEPVILHMVNSEIGTYLASNILFEICDYFQHASAKKCTSRKLFKPDTMIFNLVLDACVRFGSFFKGQRIIELMAQMGVAADAHTIIIIARIHEMNGQRDELKKFKDHIDKVSKPLFCHYRQFYDSLLSLHYKFNDIDAASGLILDVCTPKESHSARGDGKNPTKPCLIQIGSDNLKKGLKMQIFPERLQRDSVLRTESKKELILYKNGKLVPSNRALAKLIIQYKKGGRISELSNILVCIEKKLGLLVDDRLCSKVIDAFIHLGWLEAAHDILDDMELSGLPLPAASYMSLLTAYCREKLFREASALQRQIKKAGLNTNTPDEMVVSACLLEGDDESALSSKEATSFGKSGLVESLLREMREEEIAMLYPSVVYDLNSSLYFFWKAKMIGDALRTYRRMQEKNISPNVLTFVIMVHGCSSLEMYREITILWGDIKRNMESKKLVVYRDLYEFLLLNFLRGGYFERAMEVIDYMKKNDLYTDKWMYKCEFLKFHKDLYRSLKASKTRIEAQSQRLEHVRAFRKWVGID